MSDSAMFYPSSRKRAAARSVDRRTIVACSLVPIGIALHTGHERYVAGNSGGNHPPSIGDQHDGIAAPGHAGEFHPCGAVQRGPQKWNDVSYLHSGAGPSVEDWAVRARELPRAVYHRHGVIDMHPIAKLLPGSSELDELRIPHQLDAAVP